MPAFACGHIGPPSASVWYSVPMKPRMMVTALIAAIAFGCTSYEGLYSPGCPAFAGSTIKLSDGKFVWEKFTDEVIINEKGEVENQFPGYPMHGAYRIDGQTVRMEPDSGEAIDDLYLRQRDHHYFLLTAQQLDASKESGVFADCALSLGEQDDN